MTIISQWVNPKQTAIITRFDEKWSWDDFHHAVEEVHRMVAGVHHTVDLIMLHHADQPPGDSMGQFRRAFTDQPHNVGKVIVAYPKMRAAALRIIKLFARVFDRPVSGGTKVFIVQSLEEAQALLTKPYTVENELMT